MINQDAKDAAMELARQTLTLLDRAVAGDSVLPLA